MQLAGWDGTECASVSPSTNQTRLTCLGCRGTAGQPRNVAAWQFPVLPLMVAILPGIQPLCNCTGLSVTPHRSIVQTLRDACRLRGGACHTVVR